MNKELIEKANVFVKEKKDSLESIKEERKRLVSEENIIYVLTTVAERMDQDLMPIYITHNFDNFKLRILAYNEYIKKFIDLFSDKECLKMVVNNEYYKSNDLLFLIGNDLLLDMYINSDSINKEADVCLSAEVKKIDRCVAEYYFRKIYSRDSLNYEAWYSELESLVFKDSKGYNKTKIFELNDNNKEYLGKDIRELINPISIEEILERTINSFENEDAMRLVKSRNY